MFALIALVFYRVAAGPTVIDRIVAANIVGTKTTLLLVLIGTIFGPLSPDGHLGRVDMFIDLALTYALLNFIGSLAAAKYFRRHMQQQDPESSGGSGEEKL